MNPRISVLVVLFIGSIGGFIRTIDIGSSAGVFISVYAFWFTLVTTFMVIGNVRTSKQFDDSPLGILGVIPYMIVILPLVALGQQFGEVGWFADLSLGIKVALTLGGFVVIFFATMFTIVAAVLGNISLSNFVLNGKKER